MGLAVWHRICVAVAAATAAAAQAASAAAPECPPDAGGAWQRVGAEAQDVEWRAEGGTCAVPSRAELLERLAGTHVAFVGDSTMRLTFHETLIWGWGCDAAGNGGDAHVAEYYANHPTTLGGANPFPSLSAMCAHEARTGRHVTAPFDGVVIPAAAGPSARDVRLSFRWATHAWLARDAALNLFAAADPPDVLVLNTGFWHLRHPPPSKVYEGRFFGFEEGLANLVAALAEAGVARRVVWRGCNFIETSEADPGAFDKADFTNANIRYVNAAAAAALAPLGVPFYDYSRFTPEGKRGGAKSIFTDGGGYHMAQNAMRAALPGLLQTVVRIRNASAAAGTVVASPTVAGGSTTAATAARTAAPTLDVARAKAAPDKPRAAPPASGAEAAAASASPPAAAALRSASSSLSAAPPRESTSPTPAAASPSRSAAETPSTSSAVSPSPPLPSPSRSSAATPRVHVRSARPTRTPTGSAASTPTPSRTASATPPPPPTLVERAVVAASSTVTLVTGVARRVPPSAVVAVVTLVAAVAAFAALPRGRGASGADGSRTTNPLHESEATEADTAVPPRSCEQ